MDFKTLVAQMPTVVPMVGTLELEFLDLAPQRVLLRLPDKPEYRNHVGGPHAGAMFTLAETATGAIVLGNFGMLVDRATPLPVDASIRFKKIAMGPMYAEALMHDTPESIVARLDAGERPEFRIDVILSTEDWTVTGEASFLWTLKPIRRADPPARPRSPLSIGPLSGGPLPDSAGSPSADERESGPTAEAPPRAVHAGGGRPRLGAAPSSVRCVSAWGSRR